MTRYSAASMSPPTMPMHFLKVITASADTAGPERLVEPSQIAPLIRV
ncbi:hypothetical protein [Streptomyces sp. NBRC 110611]|nr:hypothetical protein [Streptomyces sp. NBRC 110611]